MKTHSPCNTSAPPLSQGGIEMDLRLKALFVIVSLAAFSTPAMAHPGHGAYGGVIFGFLHPLSGLDHLLAMIAVGVWAAQLGGRARWAVPLAFVSIMALAAALAMNGAISVDGGAIESGIAASLLVLGLFVFRAKRVPIPAALAWVGVFAAFHGLAHGSELPALSDPMRYAVGFLLATALLHGIGLAFGAVALRRVPLLGRIGGAATIAAGAAFLIGAV